MLKLSIILGIVAALADVAGGLVLVRARGIERYLRYFVALGAGFLMAVAVLEMTPESLHLSPRLGPILIMAGYCVVHLLEHTINAHFHYGEETHHDEFVSRHTGNSVLVGLSVHALFDGIAIGSGFVVSNGLGWLIFLAILLHKAPEGFTMASVMLASGRSRSAGIRLGRCPRRGYARWRPCHRTRAPMAALWPACICGRSALCWRKRPGARGQSRTRHSHGTGVFPRSRNVPADALIAACCLRDARRTCSGRIAGQREPI